MLKSKSKQHNAQQVSHLARPSLRVMSFNLRFNNPYDGPHIWGRRREYAASMLRLHIPDVVGLQEAQSVQIADLTARLPDYAWLGGGRDDGASEGEFVAIFYRPARLALLDKATFWLSKTPDVPGSINWKACCVRIVTWAKFLDRATGCPFFCFNTHFDQASEKARVKSAELLLKRIPTIAGGVPFIVTGDLNCHEDSEPYRILTHKQKEAKLHLRDASKVSVSPHHGPLKTFHAFTGILRERIDYIFVANGTRVLQHATLVDHWDGFYPSDHCPILAEVELK